MSSLVNAPTTTEKDDLIKAPKLTSSNSKAIANYLEEFEKFEQEKRAFNEVNSGRQNWGSWTELMKN
jgi:hypothetical protein